MMRSTMALVLGGAFALSGCNMVVSDEPWLARSAEAVKMKPGIWVDLDDPDCDYDVDTPVRDWPACADPALVTADGRFFGYEKKDDEWNEIEMIFDTSMPVVIQIRMPEELAAQAPEAPAFLYAGMRPVTTGADGYVSEMATWLLTCGPVDKTEGAVDDAGEFVTKQPFAGLTMVGENCHADDLAALRNAALESEALEDEVDTVRWVKHADESVMD